VYQYTIILLALFCLVNGFWQRDTPLETPILPLLLLGILVETIYIPLHRGYGTLTYGVVLGTMILYGAQTAALLVFTAGIAADRIKRVKRSFLVTLFNSSQFTLCVYVSAAIYRWLGGATRPDELLTPANLLLLIPVTASFICMNHIQVLTLFLLRGDRLERSDVTQLILTDVLNYLIAAPFAIFMFLFAKNLSVLFIIFVPLLLLGQVLKLYRRITLINKVHETVHTLQSVFDLKEIYQTITTSAERLTGSNATVLWVLRGETIYPVSISDESLRHRLPADGLSLDDPGIVASAVRTKEVHAIYDVAKDKRARTIKLSDRFQSVLVVPLKSRDRVLGVITCYGIRPFAFTDEQREMVTMMARQVGVIIENANLYCELQEATWRDPVTGLYNYRYFYEELSRRFARVKEQGLPLTIVVLDIDHFKKYNDTYGHVVGDEVLRQTGQVIQRAVAGRGVVARYGGEEFAILLDESLKQAQQTVEHLRRAIAQNRFEYQGYVVQGVTISAGLASYPEHDHDEKELLEKADQAMYWGAKQRGRNKVAVYTPDFDAHLFVDQLTGLYTHHYLRIKLLEEYAGRFGEGESPYALLFFNVVGFESINRNFDFEAGNQVLREISMILKQNVRHAEIAARYSGDQFLLFIPGIERVEAERICDRLVRTICAHPFRVRGDVLVQIDVRSDIVVHPADAVDTGHLLAQIPERFLKLSRKYVQL
jgi:diguanylate cyclase (GGDEF)-like protein